AAGDRRRRGRLRDRGGPRRGGAVGCYLVELTGPGVGRAAGANVDPTRSHGRIALDGAPGEALGAPGQGWALVERLLDRAAGLVAFAPIGGAEAALGREPG